MANHSETLEKHFETIRPTPPHEIMRQQALKQAAQYGIPYEIAVVAIDSKLEQAARLYEAMIQARIEAEGEVGELRVEVDTAMMARDVMENHGNIDAKLAELGAVHRKGVVDDVMASPENLEFRMEETTLV